MVGCLFVTVIGVWSCYGGGEEAKQRGKMAPCKRLYTGCFRYEVKLGARSVGEIRPTRTGRLSMEAWEDSSESRKRCVVHVG